jgi:hypothetical protein
MVWYYFFHNKNNNNNNNNNNNHRTGNDSEKKDEDDNVHSNEEAETMTTPTNPTTTEVTDDDPNRIDPRFLKAWWTRRLQVVEQAQEQRQQQKRSKQRRHPLSSSRSSASSSSSSASSKAAAAAATSACYFGNCGAGSTSRASGAASSSSSIVVGCDNSSVGVSVADTDCTPVISNAKQTTPYNHHQHKKQKPSLSSIPQISSFEEDHQDDDDDDDDEEQNHMENGDVQQQRKQQQQRRRKKRKLVLLSTLCFLLILFSTAAAVVAILQYQQHAWPWQNSENNMENNNNEGDSHTRNDDAPTLVPTVAATAVVFQQSTRAPDVSISVTTSSSTPAPTPNTGLVLETHTLAPTNNNTNQNTTASSSSSEQSWILLGEYPDGAFGSTLSMFQDTIIISSNGTPTTTTTTNATRVVSIYRFVPDENRYQPILTGSMMTAESGTAVALTRGTTNDTVVFAVSQPTQTIAGQPRRGMVQLYQTTTTETTTAIPFGSKLHGPDAYANFGHAIDLVSSSRGPYLVVGAPYYSQSLRLQGMVSVYEYQEPLEQWAILGGGDGNSDEQQPDAFVGNHENEWWGSAVALCEHEQHLYMAASAPREEVETQGYVALYEYKTSTTTTNLGPDGQDDPERDATSFGDGNGIWVLIGFVSNIEVVDAMAPDRATNVNDQFGASLDLQCDNQRVRLAIGIPQVQDGAGMVVVYEYSGGGSSSTSVDASSSSSSFISWTRLGDLIHFYALDSTGTSSAEFGTAVVWIDENRLAIGAPGANGRTGAVEIWQVSSVDESSSGSYFQWLDTQWGEEQGDEFGSALATTGSLRRLDGATDPQSVILLAAGAPQTSRQGQTGYVRIWSINNSEEPMNQS